MGWRGGDARAGGGSGGSGRGVTLWVVVGGGDKMIRVREMGREGG